MLVVGEGGDSTLDIEGFYREYINELYFSIVDIYETTNIVSDCQPTYTFIIGYN